MKVFKHHQTVIHYNKIYKKFKFIQTLTLIKFHKMLINKLKIKQMKKIKFKKKIKIENNYYIKKKS